MNKQWMAITAAGLTLMGLMWMATGCSTVNEDEEGDPAELEEMAQGFHTNLRWARYDHARDQVHDAYRPTFDGIFEERGDDYEIVDMRFKRAEVVEQGQEAHIQVEQSWYVLPSTTVDTERFIERWVYEDGRWWMRDRMLRSEFREQGELFDSELEEGEDPEVVEAGE